MIANARLIAAAPAMHPALRDLVSMIEVLADYEDRLNDAAAGWLADVGADFLPDCRRALAQVLGDSDATPE